MAGNMTKRATFQAQTDGDVSGEQQWPPEHIRLAAVTLLSKLPTHDETNALRIVDELRSLITDYVYRRVA